MAKPKATPKAQASTPATTAEPQTSEATETQDTTIINVSDAAQAEEQQPEPEVAEDAKPAKQKKAEAPKTVTYKSAKVETSSYDIRVSNVKIRGHWDGAHEHLVFDVPAELAEGFEKHYHYQTGRVVKA